VEKELGRAIDTAAPAGSGAKPRIGVARSMYFYDRHPFWGTYLRALGVEVVLSPKTN
jgi:predicted nucleotide-binding protein (sugar kinase/HSP70/actin superfamily)